MTINLREQIYKVYSKNNKNIKILKNISLMKRIFKLSIILLLAGIILPACGKKEAPKNTEKKVPLVKVEEIKPQSFTETYKFIGVLKPYETAKLSSEEGGIITYIGKDKGSRVSKGEVVIKLLKDQDYATYEQMQAQYNLAKDNFERIQNLYLQGAATEQQFTNSRLQLDVAEKSKNIYEVRLRKGSIVSPINGIVDAKLMSEGEMSSPGAPILSIVDVSRLKVSTGVPESYINYVKKGQVLDISFDVFPGEVYKGVVSYLSPVISASSRTFEIEMVIGNPGGKLKPEMSAKVEITKPTINDAIVLNQDQFIDNVEEQYVYVLEGSIARKKMITLGGRDNNHVVVVDGLQIGDMLITDGYQNVNDGENVQVVQ